MGCRALIGRGHGQSGRRKSKNADFWLIFLPIFCRKRRKWRDKQETRGRGETSHNQRAVGP